MLRGLISGIFYGVNIEIEREDLWIRSWLCHSQFCLRQIHGQTNSLMQVKIKRAILPWQNLLTTCTLGWENNHEYNESFCFGLLLSKRNKKRLLNEIRAFLE